MAWVALHRLAATGLATRSADGWAVAGALLDLKGACDEATILYEERLHDKAIEAGDILPDDENFCGSCCFDYDDVEEPNYDDLYDSFLGGIALRSVEVPPVEARMGFDAWRGALGGSALAVGVLVVVLVVGLLLLPFAIVYFIVKGLTKLGSAVLRLVGRIHRG